MFESKRPADEPAGNDYAQARALCAALRDFIMSCDGGRQDERAIHTVRDLSSKALTATSDPVLASAFVRINELALALFSERDHQAWDRVGQAGVVRLKLLMMRELIGIRSRLSKLESSSLFFLNGETRSAPGRRGS